MIPSWFLNRQAARPRRRQSPDAGLGGYYSAVTPAICTVGADGSSRFPLAARGKAREAPPSWRGWHQDCPGATRAQPS